MKRESSKLKRNIVFINQATGYLTIDTVNCFAGYFNKVALITGSVRTQDDELDSKVAVSKIIKYDRGNNFRKMFSWLVGTFQIYALLLTKYRSFEVVYYTVPPTAYLLAGFLKSNFSIVIYDLFPDALKIKGFSESNFIYKWWARKNASVFAKARRVVTISKSLKQKVLAYAPGAKVEVIPNWSAFSGKQPIAKEKNAIITREGLQGKFVVQYSGNIGVTHNVESVVELAEALKSHTDIEFLIIGRGERISVIKDLIETKNLTNCKLLPFRKDEELYESLCVADLALVTLDDKTPDISVPSKMYNLMAAGVPIMAIAALNSSIAEIIDQYQIGKTFERLNIEGMKKYVLELKRNHAERERLADKSLEAAQDFTKYNADRFLELCKQQY